MRTLLCTLAGAALLLTFAPLHARTGPRICVQVITAARPSPDAPCVDFPTPCAVPAGWEFCDPR